MGISINALKGLLYARSKGVTFEHTATLGRQHFFAKKEDLSRIAGHFGFGEAVRDLRFTDAFSEPFFKALGARRTDSIDFSSYEGANIIHDMNMPVSPELYEQYDVLFDGGTLEHVFNFPVAIKNCMQMVKKGGHFISVNPANNQLGHGFYQFSPELYFRIFAPENGFEIVSVFVCAGEGNFYEVKDPNEVRERVTLTNDSGTDLIVIAKRIDLKPIFTTTPQQSDYASTWKKTEDEQTGHLASPAVKGIYQKLVPAPLRAKVWKIRYGLDHIETYSADLGNFNPKHFRKADF
jgi:hypothetical protein